MPALQIELTDMVYRKAMQLSGAEVARMGVGGIANLQSNDVQKMSRFRLDINPLWDAPFQACDVIAFCGAMCCWSTPAFSTVWAQHTVGIRASVSKQCCSQRIVSTTGVANS